MDTDRNSQHRRSERIAALAQARLYLVCDSNPGGSTPEQFLPAVLKAGVDIVQLRDKQASSSDLTETAKRFRAICSATGTLFILNDRPDLVDRCDADGVHIGQDDMPLTQARELIGSERIVGLSTHTPEQIEGGQAADYIGVGPVYETPTKPGRPAVGFELVRYAARNSRIPFFAIGGVDTGNLAAVARAGASRVAVVRAITEATAAASAAKRLRTILLEKST